LSNVKLIDRAESFKGIIAGVAGVGDILKSPSYQTVSNGEWGFKLLNNEVKVTEWQDNAKSVIILGLHHPKSAPELDWWDGKNTIGNRQLMKTSDFLIEWLKNEYKLGASSLPYYVEYGGVFLKEAAVYAGLGIIGKNNLFINPEWGPRIRLRAILVNGTLQHSKPLKDFSPCDSCSRICQSVCPQKSFSTGAYSRTNCIKRINADKAKSKSVIKFCRACEFVCPVGK
jgi:epoxyqueuosine reductase